MSMPAYRQYWEQVASYWDKAVAAARTEDVTDPTRLRQYRLSILKSNEKIAITGERGAGKSVIYDAITGQIGEGYLPRGQSEDVEKRRVKIVAPSGRARSYIAVVPGQRSAERDRALENVFGSPGGPQSKLRGVIHVVCWGYQQIWSASDRYLLSRELKARGADLERIRLVNHQSELRDFDEVCQLLEDTWSSSEPGVWLIVAVTKADLYWSELDAVKREYVPTTSGLGRPFAQRLRSLADQVGHSRLKVAVTPVSSLSSPYHFDQLIKEPEPFPDGRRDALVAHLRAIFGSFIHG
jgi:hypothetical protein